MGLAKGVRFAYIANALLLGFNILFFAFVVYGWSFYVDRTVETTREAAKLWGMDLHFVKRPFTILVDKEFPEKRDFMFFEDGPNLIIAARDVDSKDAETTREVHVSLDTDFSMSFEYSLADGTQVQHLEVWNGDQGFVDYDADGVFDLRKNGAPVEGVDVWYEGKWQEVEYPPGESGWDNYKMRLAGGEEVSFDSEAGLWLSSK